MLVVGRRIQKVPKGCSVYLIQMREAGHIREWREMRRADRFWGVTGGLILIVQKNLWPQMGDM